MTRGIEWPNAYCRGRTAVVEYSPEAHQILSLEGVKRLQGYLAVVAHELEKAED